MLLGLAAAVLLAMLLQLNALRARRAQAFEFATDGVIQLRAWVVLATTPAGEEAPPALEMVRQVLMLPGRVVSVVNRRCVGLTGAPLAVLTGLRQRRCRPPAATGPPGPRRSLSRERRRSPRLPTRTQRPPDPPGGRFSVRMAGAAIAPCLV